MSGDVPEWLGRYAGSLLPVFGVPQTVLSHGQGCYVVDVDGKRYLDPVSYTHLRAHETVLDLVCRLLLEHKNDEPVFNHSCHIIHREQKCKKHNV